MVTLSSRSDSYVSRVVVPSDLRHLVGRREILKSLRCSSYRRARLLGAQWEGNLAKLFTILRTHHQVMTQEQIDALVQEYLSTTLDRCEQERIDRGRMSEEEQEATWLALSDLLDSTVMNLTDHDYRRISPTVDELLASHKLTLAKTSPAYKKLCRSVLVAQQRVVKMEMDRLSGNYLEEHPLHPTSAVYSNQEPSRPHNVFASTPTIKEAVALYMEHYAHRDQRTNNEKATVLKRFTESLPANDATLLKDIIKAQCIAFRSTYGQLPKRIPDKLRGLPMAEILSQSQDKPYIRMTHSTVNQGLSDLRHFFSWAIRHDHYMGKNPCEGIDYEGVKKRSYEPFTDADIKAAFTHPDFLAQRTKNPPRFWLPLMLLYTGARRSEIDQLALADIRQSEDGIWYMDLKFEEDRGRRLKNTASIRRVPIHSHLLELGLRTYISERECSKGTMLFPKPPKKKGSKGRETVGDAVGKWWARLLKDAGIKGHKTLHSLRHTVVTRLAAASVPQDIREILVGHASAGVHSRVYMHRDQIPLKLLQENLEKLDYRNLLSVR